MNRQEIGKLGESYAEKFLLAKGYKILEKNFRWRGGEIDLIAFDGELVFIEVKTRSNHKFGHLQETISKDKQRKLISTALHYLNSSAKRTSLSWRIDLIAVKLDSKLNFKDLIHIKNALDG